MECFNCFQQGFCPYGVKSKKMLYFCSRACAHVQMREIALRMVEEDLNLLTDTLEQLKTKTRKDGLNIPFQKIIFTQRLLYKALMAEKPKAELHRLYDLLKDQMVDILPLIGDKNSENSMLLFADKMKDVDDYVPHLIDVLGS